MSYSSVILADTPQAWYRLSDASGLAAHDSSGNGYNATLPSSGVTYSQPGAIVGDTDTSMLFSASATLSLPYNLNPSTWTALSLEFWTKLSGGWQYVVVTTSNSGSTILYLNGVAYSSGSGDFVGIDTDIYYAGSPLSGGLDEIGLYNYVLTPAQILNHYLVGLNATAFYASNVAQTISSLILSDQLSQTTGGTETSVSVTMPSSGSNLYVELLSQGGTSSGTAALPAPTGKGWSIPLQGSTILAGLWSSIFTLAKSGTALSGGSLIVRFYRRTFDGTYYPITVSTLSSQTFSTKASYSTPAVTVNVPWQFVQNEVLYVDCFAFNGSTAWASDVFTVYVSNSASLGVAGDGMIIAPQMIATPAGLSCYIGVNAFTSGTNSPILNEAFQIADALDQRSVLTCTIEDANGTLSYQPNMPIVLSDSIQGKLYDGYLAKDQKSKVSADPNDLRREHMLTSVDHHRDYDKEANGIAGTNNLGTNYSNWTAGDVACDFIDKVESQNGIWGEYAIEADYSQAAFAQGTLTNVTATNTTNPFVYAPNVASPPVTTNTGSLELTRAGTKYTLTESVTSDFASGTLTNMTASSNALKPTTQSAVKVTAELTSTTTINYPNSANFYYNTNTLIGSWVQTAESLGNWAWVQIWNGSQTIGSNDTFNYDLWISSTSPAFLAGVDFICSDGTELTQQIGLVESNGNTGLFDQNNVSVDPLTDLTNYAKDQWYTRQISLTGLNGKTIQNISIFIAGETSGYYTVYAKNIYLSSASGSPFFSTTATNTQLNPTAITVGGNFVASAVISSVVNVYQPAASSRVSPAHSISGVGLVQDSKVSWTASLPTNGPSVSTAVSPYITTTIPPANTAPSLVVLASYDNATWLPCANNEPLPGLPAGANVSGLSLYLKESFAAGSDPSAIPALLQVQITINSAASQTTTDIVTAYGNATGWNSGTYNGTALNSNNQLTQTGTYSRNWSSHSTAGQVFTYSSNVTTASASASSGSYVMTVACTGTTFASGVLSRLDFVGTATDFKIEFDIKMSDANNQNVYAGLVYRCSGLIDPITTTSAGGSVGGVCFNSGYALCLSNSKIVLTPFSGGSIFMNSFESASSPHVTVATGLTNNSTYHLVIVVKNNRHTLYFNNTSSAPVFDVFDNTTTSGGGFGFYGFNFNGTTTETFTFNNLSMTPITQGTWTSPTTSLTSLGTCGNTQVVWNEENLTGAVGTTAAVFSSLDSGTTWQQCTNGSPIPGLASGTNVSGKSLVIQILLNTTNSYMPPIITGLYARVCGSYGTVSGTRVSPALPLTNVGYVAASNCAWHANVPTNTSVTIATSQDAATWTTVGNSGAGASLGYWTNQPSATQDLFNSNTSSNYTNTSKSGGSAAAATYDTTNTRITLAGGSSGLYLNNAINCADVDLLCDMDQSDAGGLCWRVVSTSNYYELGVYDASSSGGFTNQLRLYKVASGTRSLLASASIVFTRTVKHRIRAKMKGGLISVYWDGTCKISLLEVSPLGSGQIGLRNDGGTSEYYQFWAQPLGANLSGQVLYLKTTLTTSDPAYMPQVFTQLCCVRGPSIGTGATIYQLHPPTLPFAAYYSAEMDSLVQTSSNADPLGYYWYVDKWKQLWFGGRSARPGAFPIQSTIDTASTGGTPYSGYLLFNPSLGMPQVSVTNSADPLRNQQIVSNVSGLVSPPPEVKTADGSTTSWALGYPVYSAPVITINGQPATIGIQGIDSGVQFYWQPNSTSISYDSSLPKLPSGTVISITYVGQSPINTVVNNTAAQAIQAALEGGNSGRIAEIESALSAQLSGMNGTQAQAYAQGLLTRFGNNNPSEVIGTTLYQGLAPGNTIPVFIPELDEWNTQLPIVKVVTTAFTGQNGLIYLYSVDATNGANTSQWQRAWK